MPSPARVLLINYANEVFSDSQRLNVDTGRRVGGFDQVNAYAPGDIDAGFAERNRHILRRPRGNGVWLWKPYFIRRSLDLLDEGDFLFYCDAGSQFIAPIAPLVELARARRQDLLVFELVHIERKWTKRDAFVLMDCDQPRFTDSKQRLGGFSLWRKSEFSVAFADQWLDYAQDERILTDIENQCGLPNYPDFQAHRHDQSILSLLSKRHGLEAYRDPSQWGNGVVADYPNSPYGQIIDLTRARNAPKPAA